MFDKLPPHIQAEIKQLLIMNDFRAAKALYDKFIAGLKGATDF